MSFIQVTKEEFNTHAQQVSERSFMQTEEMAKLLEKRGFSISYVAWKEGNQLEISAIVNLRAVPTYLCTNPPRRGQGSQLPS